MANNFDDIMEWRRCWRNAVDEDDGNHVPKRLPHERTTNRRRDRHQLHRIAGGIDNTDYSTVGYRCQSLDDKRADDCDDDDHDGVSHSPNGDGGDGEHSWHNRRRGPPIAGTHRTNDGGSIRASKRPCVARNVHAASENNERRMTSNGEDAKRMNRLRNKRKNRTLDGLNDCYYIRRPERDDYYMTTTTTRAERRTSIATKSTRILLAARTESWWLARARAVPWYHRRRRWYRLRSQCSWHDSRSARARFSPATSGARTSSSTCYPYAHTRPLIIPPLDHTHTPLRTARTNAPQRLRTVSKLDVRSSVRSLSVGRTVVTRVVGNIYVACNLCARRLSFTLLPATRAAPPQINEYHHRRRPRRFFGEPTAGIKKKYIYILNASQPSPPPIFVCSQLGSKFYYLTPIVQSNISIALCTLNIEID